MTRFALLLTLLLSTQLAAAQHTVVQEIIDDISLDSMLLWCGDITGENAVTVNGVTDTIKSRNSNNPGNERAYQYLLSKLQSFGLEVDSQLFNISGRNLIARQPGAVHPGKRWLLTSHYDAVGGPVLAPAADDDGSGTVAGLEAARILSKHQFAYTIEYLFFDEEEQGLQGSAAHAQASGGNGDTLMGVINMDAIAWDGDGDGLARIHTRPVDESEALADSIVAVHDRYNIGLNLVVNNPGATYSDHASFWNQGFSAVLLIEDFDNDGNPHYHTETDLMQYFDLDYFHKLSRLSIASLATLAEPMEPSSVPTVPARASLRVFPNPASEQLRVQVPLNSPGQAQLQLFNATGNCVFQQHFPAANAPQLQASIAVDQFAPGLYFLRATQLLQNGTWSVENKRIAIAGR